VSACASARTRTAGCFSMIPHARAAAAGAPCPVAAIATKSEPFPAAIPRAAGSKDNPSATNRAGLLYVFGRFALRPRIVAVRENQPLA
jgi:hypothetical protein